MEKPKTSFIRVYCPELMAMINPGEWTDCPFFRGQTLDVSDEEDILRQIFRCHVQCDSKIQYQYFEGGKLVEKVEESVEDQEALRRILALVMKPAKKSAAKKEKKVLLVDDDEDFLEMHSAVLRNRGYQVTTAQSAKQALEALAATRPDVVVLDVMLEQFDTGFKLCQTIKKKHRDLPVMLLTSIGAQTGLEFSGSSEILKVTGADAFLDKPVSPKVFIEHIEKLTEGRKKI